VFEFAASEFPFRSFTLLVTVAMYAVAADSDADGVNVTIVFPALIVSVPATIDPSVVFVTKKLALVMKAELIASLNVHTIAVVATTAVAPFVGDTVEIVGAVESPLLVVKVGFPLK
jgi:hypothetical protein